VLKGQAGKSLAIPTGQSDCDYFLPPNNPKVGEAFLLFLESSNGRLVASRCTVSGRVAERTEELRALRKGFKPGRQ